MKFVASLLGKNPLNLINIFGNRVHLFYFELIPTKVLLIDFMTRIFLYTFMKPSVYTTLNIKVKYFANFIA